MSRPGPRNLITDVDGITIGNAAGEGACTGVTVVLPQDGAVAAADVRGGGPGTREIDLLDPSCLVERIDGICLSGGSVHGLGAGDAVVGWLHEQHQGFALGAWSLPIVPGAIIFDLGLGGTENRGRYPGYGDLARVACETAGEAFPLGNIGAGMGARAGRLKGGLGSASVVSGDGLQVAALAVANPVGSTVMPGCGTLWAWALERNGEMGRQKPPGPIAALDEDLPVEARIGGNTTLAVVATNATLDKAQAQRIAMMAHDGMARAIRPLHTPFDGDTVFALSTTRMALPEPSAMSIARIGAIAADCLARAIGRAVFAAEPLGDAPSYRQSYPEAFADGAKTG
ncbi:MAG: P1 family peptidase [Alphaproteobacteria bacterium]|nr:P1 family peptidase [Alphaproteobacteria bacterium]